MPSSYTTSGIELIGDGEQSGSWGDTTNTNLQIIDRLTSQAGTITLAGTTHTLSLSDGTLSDGQYAVLVFGGAPSGTNTVTISPNDAKRVFIVKNGSGASVVLTQGSGGNVTVADGKTAIVYCDGAGSGAEVVNVSEDFVSGTLSAIGALTPTDGNFIVGNGSTWVAESGNTVLASIGVTATATELNVLDGVTANTSELNVLDGITASTAELNILDGVTATASELNILDGVTATASELNVLDGITATTTELNYTDGVTGPIQPSLVPAGAVMSFAMNTAPSGWLKANGAAVSRTTYAALFAAIGTTFGSGDGSTTFNLPDMRGEFARGWDDGRGVDSGRSFGSAQDQSTEDLYAQVTMPNTTVMRRISTPTWTTTHTDSDVGGTAVGSRDTGAGVESLGTGETRPRNIALLYCIKT